MSEKNAELLIEIGVEELPAIPLLKQLENIKEKYSQALKTHNLFSEFEFFYTPRRLVFFHKNFKLTQPNSKVEFIGAPKNVAFKDGVLSAAAKSFLEKANISESEIEFKNIKGKEVLYHEKEVLGKPSKELLPSIIESFLGSLNFGKAMRWGEHKFEFIRAIRWLVCLLDDELVEFESYGVKSAKKTMLHRSVSYDFANFNNTNEYFSLLENNFVILDPLKREAKIKFELEALAKEHKVQIAQDDELLAEVVAITEYPKALFGSFEKEFLQIASEVIITSMRENQRYFAVLENDKLSNHFIVVSNAVCKDYSKIINGNERVLKARLSDAMFFWQNDLKSGLCPEKLSKMQFLEALGTMSDKTEREIKIAEILCKMLKNSDFENIKTALKFAKADLASQMVYEFTNLQGIMGAYYAKNMGFSDEICNAIKEQYLPNAENAPLPSSEFSKIVALANKLDILLGLFSINKIPSGTKDPYALRRAANGVIKIILALNKNLNLNELLNALKSEYASFDIKILQDFIFERLFTFYDANASFIKAVLANKNSDLIYINECINALIKLSLKPDFSENFSTFKRLANIAVKTEAKIDESLFENEAENALYKAFKAINESKIEDKLQALFKLKSYIDNFFEKVMINVENEKLKNNRQALIFAIYSEFLNIADIKELSL